MTLEGNPSGRSLIVDARGIDQSGIGRYLREVLERLLLDSRLHQVTLAGDENRLRGFLAGLAASARPGIAIVPFPFRFYSAAAHLRWGLLETAGPLRGDVTFFPHYDVPVGARNCRRVVVVHDLIHFRLPHLYPFGKRLIASAVLRNAIRRAKAVVALSDSTRRDLVQRHPEISSRVTVIPNGVRADFSEGPIAAELHGRPIDAWQPFLLCVGNRKPHKNLTAAVEALALLRPRWPDLRLLVVGRPFGDDTVGARARALGLEGSVMELDEVTDAELRALYRAAEALIFPSLYEGFGLPVLEAMAFGLPVIASNRASIPEVVGEAGLLVDPEDISGIAAAVQRLREEPELRQRFREAGRQRAAEFSWEVASRRTADLLVRVADGGGGVA